MKRVVFIIFLMILYACSEDAIDEGSQNTQESSGFMEELAWIKSYGGTGDDTAQSIIGTIDGGYAVLGHTKSTDGDITGKSLPVNDYWLLKLNSEGELQWNRTYGGSKDDRGQSVIQTSDGGFAIVGYAMSSDGDGSNNEGFHDNWILKLTADGDIEWERSFGFSGHDHSYDLLQTEDGGYFFVGFLDAISSEGEGDTGKGNSSLTNHGVGEFWGTKLDAQGNLQWRRYFGGTNNDRAYAVAPAKDGGFVMTGFSESDDMDISLTKGSYDFWAVKVGPEGEFVWERSYGGSGIEVSNDIVSLPDGGFAIVGKTFSTDGDISENKGESDFWLIRIGENGELLWEKTYGGSGFEDGLAINVTNDGGLVLCGNSKSSDKDLQQNAGENDFWVLETDASGKLLWQQSYGGSGLDFAFDVLESSDGGLIVVGQTGSTDFPGIQDKGGTDLVVLRIE